MSKRKISELQQMQALPLPTKVLLTKDRIRQWVNEYGEDGVYISFSGGKDSTVLLHIARSIYPNLLAVFVDTGLEYPEVREFVKTFDNVEWLKPKKTFRQVINDYGYPFISKEVSECVYGARKYLDAIAQSPEADEVVARSTPHTDTSIESLWDWENIPKFLERKGLGSGGSVQRLAIMCGCLTRDQKVMANIPSGNKSAYNQERYKFLLDADFSISNRCCSVMKKSPAHTFTRETGRHPMTAQMASESRLRTQQWLKNGCNGFQMKEPVSNPMSFWTEQDVLLYIKLNNLPIASVYGDIVFEDGEQHELSANTSIFDEDRPLLKTTGCDRTGCMFCGFGCHLENQGEGRFARMKETHPKLYDYIMRPIENGGLNYKHIIDWINEHGHFNIEY